MASLATGSCNFPTRVYENSPELIEDLAGLMLEHEIKPDILATVFAGADVEATDRARSYFTGYPPSSPSVALLRDGKLVYLMERHQIENQEATSIARELSEAFDKHCARTTAG